MGHLFVQTVCPPREERYYHGHLHCKLRFASFLHSLVSEKKQKSAQFCIQIFQMHPSRKKNSQDETLKSSKFGAGINSPLLGPSPKF